MPLKLLKPKQISFKDDDDAFVEHFLNEKRKQEAALKAEKKKKKSSKGYVQVNLGVTLNGVIKQWSLAASEA